MNVGHQAEANCYAVIEITKIAKICRQEQLLVFLICRKPVPLIRSFLMIYKGVQFNLTFVEGNGDVANMPTHGGIYAEIHWPTRSIRIGETGNSMRGRNRSHMRWADKHRNGAHNEKEAARQGIIVDLVKVWGSEGLEYYVITDDPRVREDRELRVDCERHLHEWAREQNEFLNINTQRGYRTRN